MQSKYGFETTPTRSLIMSRIKSENTTPEVIFRKQLWHLGYRYRINYRDIPGKPDIVLTRLKLAIFIDGDFWHGYDWEEKKSRLVRNKEYWVKKIEGNIQRDKRINSQLMNMGWHVLRFWEHEIVNHLEDCTAKTIDLINNIQQSLTD